MWSMRLSRAGLSFLNKKTSSFKKEKREDSLIKDSLMLTMINYQMRNLWMYGHLK